MKRRIFKLSVFLLLGAIINIAVAWGCALWLDVSTGVRGPIVKGGCVSSDRPPVWHVESIRRSGAIRYCFIPWDEPHRRDQVIADVIPTWSSTRAVNFSDSRSWWREPVVVEDARGLPMLALWCRFPLAPILNSLEPTGVEGGIAIDQTNWPTQPGANRAHSAFWDVRALPLRPIWPGFAINTMFYAAVLWLLFAFPFALRRRRRIKAGCCTACGYDLRGIDHKLCPECGASASKPS